MTRARPSPAPRFLWISSSSSGDSPARSCAAKEVGLVAAGYPAQEILELYPYLEAEDVRGALAYQQGPSSLV